MNQNWSGVYTTYMYMYMYVRHACVYRYIGTCNLWLVLVITCWYMAMHNCLYSTHFALVQWVNDMSTDVCICHIGASTIVWLPHKSFQRTDQNMEESMVQCVYMCLCFSACQILILVHVQYLCIFAFGSAWPLIHVQTMYMYSCVSLAEVHVHVYYIYNIYMYIW